MGKYISAKITKIKLDQKQSILQVCRLGGIYLLATETTRLFCSTQMTTFGGNPRCFVTPKGAVGGLSFMNFSPANCDSQQSLPS